MKSSAWLLLSLAGAAGAQTVHHHRVRTHKAAPCPPTAPLVVLPPGIPPVSGPVQTAFALRYVDTLVGAGPVISSGEFLTVNYTGWLASDGTKFDSSYDHGAPITFLQGEHRVISGWDEGLVGMRVGGKRRLFIPYQLAYGDAGRGPIPPRSDLIFDVELVAASTTPPGEAPLPPQPDTPPQPNTPPQPQAPPQPPTPSSPGS